MKRVLLAIAACLFAVALSWLPLANQFDNDAYDWMSRLFPAPSKAPQAVIVAIDESTLQTRGGMRALRSILADTLERVAAAGPRVVAIDFTLADPGDPAEDARLANAMQRTPNLVLATDIAQDRSGWQDPIAPFAAAAAALGHVHADPDPVCRWIQLDKAAGRARRWALALEVVQPGTLPLEEGDRLWWADVAIPSHRVRVVYTGNTQVVPAASFAPDELRDKTVFVGATALTAARDRLMTPLGRMMPGVEIHAELFETIRTGRFRVDPPPSAVLLLQLLLGAAAAFGVYRFGYGAGLLVLLAAHTLPLIAFPRGLVLPVFSLAIPAWLTALAAAAFRYVETRRNLHRAEADKDRYQRAIHWVTHEMRSPLTAIQGSSELMTRYSLPAEKQKQIADMINAESKRMAKMIQTFLDVERLSSGDVALKRDRFSAGDVVSGCIARAEPLAERKQQRIHLLDESGASLSGDRELLEFALYNLLTNAIKYSPEGAGIRVTAESSGGHLRIAVHDEGMGIEEKDIARLGTRFFRTRRAEESGIQGTGIGLSIVQEIVARHGGRLEVASRIGEGSCFTIVVPVPVDSEVTTPR
jgi:signal transduction histidine kinase